MKIIIAPDNRLNQVSKKVEILDNTVISILNQMLECMYKNKGIGLAAPQVGILKRLVVVDCSDKNNFKKPLKLINPEIFNHHQRFQSLRKDVYLFQNNMLKLKGLLK